MSIKVKLLTLFIIPLLAFIFTAGVNISNNLATAKEAKGIVALVELVVSLNGIGDALQDERTFSILNYLEKDAWRTQLNKQRKETDNKLAKHKAMLKSTDMSRYSKDMSTALDERTLVAVEEILASRDEVDNFTQSPERIIDQVVKAHKRIMWASFKLTQEDKSSDVLLDVMRYLNLVKMKQRMGDIQSVMPLSIADKQITSNSSLTVITTKFAEIEGYDTNVRLLAKDELLDHFKKLRKDQLINDFYKPLQKIILAGVNQPLNMNLKSWVTGSDKILTSLRQIEDFSAQQVVATAKRENEQANLSLTLWLTAVLAILAGTLVIGWFLMKRINRPLAAMADRLQDIAEGEGDLTKNLDNLTHDEIGVVGTWVNLIIQNLRQLIIDIKSTTEQVTHSTNETITFSELNNQAIEQQSNQVNMVVTAINEMTVTSQQIAGNASTAADSANEGQNYVALSNSKVSENCRAIEDVVTQIDIAADQVADLEKNTKQIHTILSTIQNIAEQTNLLALNAAIEAARAGEQGRGFAVVADEVRSLAQRTQESTGEISTMLDLLQRSTSSVVSAMDLSQDKSGEGLIKAQDVAKALEQVSQSVDIINDMNIQIASETEEQSCVFDEMNRNMIEIQQQSDIVKQQSTHALSSGQDLGQIATLQQDLVAKFST